MKNTDIQSRVDQVVAKLIERNQNEMRVWGKTCKSGILCSLIELNFDGRSVKRNHELIDALKKDPRVQVGNDIGVHFADVKITLK